MDGVTAEKTNSALNSYNPRELRIATICSHSALQIFYGAKREGFKTIGIVKRDRKFAYDAFEATRPDTYIEVGDWRELLSEENQEKLVNENAILVPHGSFVEYVGPRNMLSDLYVPMLGNRHTLEWESDRRKQREWLKGAGVNLPREYSSPDDIDGKVFVKFSGARGGKGFFTASSKGEYFQTLNDRIKDGSLKEEDATNATIQQFLPGVRYYPHYFFSPFQSDGSDSLKNRLGRLLLKRLGLYHSRNAGLKINGGVLAIMGFDKRIEPIDEAYRGLPNVGPEFYDYTITGNVGVTLRESLLPPIIKMGMDVVSSSKELMPSGIVGPFALETFFHPNTGFTVFEISARIVAGTNPFGEGSEYSIWAFGRPVSTGRRIAMEIKIARERGELQKIVS